MSWARDPIYSMYLPAYSTPTTKSRTKTVDKGCVIESDTNRLYVLIHAKGGVVTVAFGDSKDSVYSIDPGETIQLPPLFVGQFTLGLAKDTKATITEVIRSDA